MFRRGIMLLDAMIALGIVAILILVLSIAMARQQRASRALAEHRRAIRAAEAAMMRMQAGQDLPDNLFDVQLSQQPLASNTAPAGYHWIHIEAKADHQQSDLIGLVPQTQPATRPATGALP